MKFLSYLAFLYALISLVIVVLALRHQARTPLHWAVAWTAFFNALWAGAMTVVYGARNLPTILWFYHASYVGALFVVPAEVVSYLLLAGVPAALWRWVGVTGFAFSGLSLVLFFTGGFYYNSFHPGSWGNVGVLGPPVFWPSATPFFFAALELVAFVSLLGARTKARSSRRRWQLTVAALSFPATFSLFFLGWFLEDNFGFPPVELFTGGCSAVVVLTLILRLHSLRPEGEFLNSQLPQAVLEVAFLLDKNHRIVGAHPTLEDPRLGEGPLQGLDFATLLHDTPAWAGVWSQVTKNRAPSEVFTGQLAGTKIQWTLAPQYDSFGDFIGAVVLIAGLNGANSPGEALTPREMEVAGLLAQGASNKAIATKLFVSVGTVKSHVHSILQKTGIQRRGDFVVQGRGGE